MKNAPHHFRCIPLGVEGGLIESNLPAYLLAPIGSTDFVTAYSLPYVAVAVLQAVALYAIGAILGLSVAGSVALVFLVLFVMAVFYVALGMILGALLPIAPIPPA